jgi:molybdate transport system regulatory protein
MARLTIRIDFEGSESFGPGKVRLLELIDAHGSIRSAASAMNMSYRHAWLLLQAVEDTFGAPVISTATGGAKGGGAKLTELGRSLVARYRLIESQAAKATAGELSELMRTTSGSTADERGGGKRRDRAQR